LSLTLDHDGAELARGLAAPRLVRLRDLFDAQPSAPGVRLSGIRDFDDIIQATLDWICRTTGNNVRPVRAIAFNKSDGANWSLTWHQDRTICIKERFDLDGFGPWSTKQGLFHVEPPFEYIESMVTARMHLDPVGPNNAPLKIIRGSHRFGKVADRDVPKLIAQDRLFECHAEPGDVWFYSTPILHASDRAERGSSRRVLQVDFSPDDLPKPLEWQL